MISKRFQRSSRPVESIKQFALNTSKGIDGTAPPTDNSNVLGITNLIGNLDGSLSLRKPIKCSKKFKNVSKVFRMFDSEHYVACSSDNYLVILDANGDRVQFTFETRNYYNPDIVSSVEIDTLKNIDVQNFNAVNFPTTTVLGNVFISPNDFRSSLPPSLFESDKYPRFLKIQKATDSWKVSLVSPEPNVLTTAEDGSLAFDINYYLDNPYNLRDTYGNLTTSVKGILGYAYSKRESNGEVFLSKPAPDSPFFENAPEVRDIDIGISIVANTVSGVPDDGRWNLVEDNDYHQKYTRTWEGTVEGSGTQSSTSASRESFKIDATMFYIKNSKRWQLNGFEARLTLVQDCPDGYDVAVAPSIKASLMAIPLFGGAAETIGLNYGNSYKVSDIANSLKTIEISAGLDGLDVYTFPSPDDTYVEMSFKGTVTAYPVKSNSASATVAKVTEGDSAESFRILDRFPTDSLDKSRVLLKAFCNLGNASDSSDVYAIWFRSKDGSNWIPCNLPQPAKHLFENASKSDSSEDVKYEFGNVNNYYRLRAYSPSDPVMSDGTDASAFRADVYPVSEADDFPNTMYMFRVVKAKDDKVEYELGRSLYLPPVGLAQIKAWSYGNPAEGVLKTYSKRLLSCSNPKFENIVYYSHANSFIFPLSEIADVNTGSWAEITTTTSWKGYTIAATKSSISLIMPQELGWTSKALTTSVGIPNEDSRCCLPGLNGILFKSGSSIYMLYPNAYAGDDTQVYVTHVSKPVDHILEEYSGDGAQFAFATSSEYVLMLPDKSNTRCLRYSYDTKTWTYCTYPVRIVDYSIYSSSSISLYAENVSLVAEPNIFEFEFDADPEGLGWGDTLGEYVVDDFGVQTPVLTPILFELDTGMKTDNLVFKKQFVESKFVIATEDEYEVAFNDIVIAIDGDPHVHRIDPNSDAAFWREDFEDKGVLGTTFRLAYPDSSKSLDVLRQLIIRYSGKGRSVRHIVRGIAKSNFRLYETYVRYKNLNVKK